MNICDFEGSESILTIASISNSTDDTQFRRTSRQMIPSTTASHHTALADASATSLLMMESTESLERSNPLDARGRSDSCFSISTENLGIDRQSSLRCLPDEEYMAHGRAGRALWVQASLTKDVYESGEVIGVRVTFGSAHEAKLVDSIDVEVVQTAYAAKEDHQIAFQTYVGHSIVRRIVRCGVEVLGACYLLRSSIWPLLLSVGLSVSALATGLVKPLIMRFLLTPKQACAGLGCAASARMALQV